MSVEKLHKRFQIEAYVSDLIDRVGHKPVTLKNTPPWENDDEGLESSDDDDNVE